MGFENLMEIRPVQFLCKAKRDAGPLRKLFAFFALDDGLCAIFPEDDGSGRIKYHFVDDKISRGDIILSRKVIDLPLQTNIFNYLFTKFFIKQSITCLVIKRIASNILINVSVFHNIILLRFRQNHRN